MDFYFDDTYDMCLDGADIRFTNDDNKVVQRLIAKLQLVTGEWFLDKTIGLPYPQIIFEVQTSMQDIYNLLRDTIKNTEGVYKINSLVLTPDADSRRLDVQVSVNENTNLEITLP